MYLNEANLLNNIRLRYQKDALYVSFVHYLSLIEKKIFIDRFTRLKQFKTRLLQSVRGIAKKEFKMENDHLLCSDRNWDLLLLLLLAILQVSGIY